MRLWISLCFILLLSVLCPAVLRADLNGDCRVDMADLAIMMSEWMESEDCMALSDNLVAHYKMNDNLDDKVVLNAVGLPNGTSVRNTSVLHIDGKVGGAFNQDYEELDNVDTGQTFNTTFTADFTINLWVKLNDGIPASLNGFFGQFSDDGGMLLWYNSSGFYGYYYTVGEYKSLVVEPNPLSDGVQGWMMITFIVKQLTPTTGQIYLYLDGVLQTNSSEPSVLQMSTFSTYDTFWVGCGYSYYEAEILYTRGAIDNCMIFNKALNTDEISFLYNSGSGTEDVSGLEPSGGIAMDIFEEMWEH